MSITRPPDASPRQPLRTLSGSDTEPLPPSTRLVGRVRVPLAGPYRPWARLFRLPDGRTLWTIRLWEVDRPVARVVSTAVLLAYARTSRLPTLVTETRALAARADEDAALEP
jgi:hypothetical protein